MGETVKLWMVKGRSFGWPGWSDSRSAVPKRAGAMLQR